MRDDLPDDLSKCFGLIKSPLQSKYPVGTLSVCMIVKDEADNIEAAIEDFSRFADEIIVNDTGSADDTIEKVFDASQKLFDKKPGEIGRHCQVKLIENPWEDDFSKARNQSLKAATSRWVIWMDADDRVSPEEAQKFRHLKESPLDRMFGFQCTNTQKGGKPIGSVFTQVRMFPNHPDLYFEKCVHEQMVYSAARVGLHVVYTDAKILHTGYESEELKKSKARRNLKMYNSEPGLDTDPTLKFCLGDTYCILEDWEKAIQIFEEIDAMPRCKEKQVQIWENIPERIGSAQIALNEPELAAGWFEEGILRNPENIENYFNLAEISFKQNEVEMAREWYIKTINCKKKISSCANHFDNMQLLAFHNLLRILIILGHYQDSVKLIEFMTAKYKTYRLEYDRWKDKYQAFESAFHFAA